jgi:hypothetical protein
MISAKLLPVIEKDSVQPDCVIVTPAPAIAAEIASTPWIAFVAPKVLSSDEVDARLLAPAIICSAIRPSVRWSKVAILRAARVGATKPGRRAIRKPSRSVH